jgi:hypothetical protein
VVGKQTKEDEEILVYNEDPLVKVTISEITCEYNFSNPTKYFNLSVPHLEIKQGLYQTLSYQGHKQKMYQT